MSPFNICAANEANRFVLSFFSLSISLFSYFDWISDYIDYLEFFFTIRFCVIDFGFIVVDCGDGYRLEWTWSSSPVQSRLLLVPRPLPEIPSWPIPTSWHQLTTPLYNQRLHLLCPTTPPPHHLITPTSTPTPLRTQTRITTVTTTIFSTTS